ncbi:hypothetical protein P4E94_01555 [Pontiellaceae bacterium B12219]|nr:hypothetical protein [Pontiellaceae bacterium B12219]
MNKSETRRIVPISTLTLICVVVLALFQMVFLFGVYEIKTTTVKSAAPWFYWTFRKMVGETTANRQRMAAAVSGQEQTSPSLATVAGFKPEELSVQIENIENPPPATNVLIETAPAAVIPVSEPEKEPADENEPVG